MDNANSLYRVHQCSKCPGDMEYQCLSCPCNLCPQCKETHVKDLKTIDHNTELCREKSITSQNKRSIESTVNLVEFLSVIIVENIENTEL